MALKALYAGGFERLAKETAQHLKSRRLDDGTWPSYWYTSRLYSTAHALEAISLLEGETADTAGLRDLFSDLDVKDAFSRALAVEIAGHCDVRTEDLVGDLLASQRLDGRWACSTPFMLPDPWNYTSEESDAAVCDQNSLFTTATVLRSLEKWSRA